MALAMKMRKCAARAGICIALAVAGLSGCSLSTPSIAEVSNKAVEQTVSDDALVAAGTLTVAVDASTAPQVVNTSDGYEGYAVDVAKALADRMGLKVAFVDVASGRNADIALTTTTSPTSSAKNLGDYCEYASSVFGNTDASSSLSSDALNTAAIGVQENSASQDALNRAGISGEQKTYSTINACFEALASGEVDYVACDALSGAYVARIYTGTGFLGTISSVSTAKLYVLGSSDDLSSAVNDAFEGISGDGVLDAVYASWFGDLPESLSDSLVSGVTITATSEKESSNTVLNTEDADDGTATITDSDINSLS